jgi:hypothetical protein
MVGLAGHALAEKTKILKVPPDPLQRRGFKVFSPKL